MIIRKTTQFYCVQTNNWNSKKKLIFSLIINLLFASALLYCFPLSYEMADDVIYSRYIAEGSYNIIFSNYFLLFFIGLVQNLIYPINAYVLISLLLSFASFVAITRVFADKFNAIVLSCAILFLYSFFGVNHFETISLTRIPTILTVAGFLCIIHYFEKKKLVFGIIGCLFVIIGSFFRFEIFIVSSVFFVVYIIILSVRETLKKSSEKFIKSFLAKVLDSKLLFSLLAIILICLSFNSISHSINTSTKELIYYQQYTSARSAVIDYSIPSYQEAREDYDNINIDGNDIDMLQNQYMDDGGAFSLDKLKDIKKIKDTYTLKHFSFLDLTKNIFLGEISNAKELSDRGVIYFAFGVLFLVVCLMLKKRNLLIVFSFLLLIFLFYFYLYYIDRVVFRAVYILWFSSIIYLMYSISFAEFRDVFQNVYLKKLVLSRIAIVFITIIISSFGLYISSISNYTNASRMSKDDIISSESLYSYLMSKKWNRYEISRNILRSWYVPENIFIVSKESNQNFKDFFNVYYKYPQDLEDTKKILNTDNMYCNLLKKGVYFVDDKKTSIAEQMQKYLQKYYSKGKTVNYKTVESFKGFKIIKYEYN